MCHSHILVQKQNKLSVALSEDVLVGFFLFWIKHIHEFGLLCEVVVERLYSCDQFYFCRRNMVGSDLGKTLVEVLEVR